jgi:hypothetical protein
VLRTDSFTLLNAELNDKQLAKKRTNKLYTGKLRNSNTTAHSFITSLTFLHNFFKFLEELSL